MKLLEKKKNDVYSLSDTNNYKSELSSNTYQIMNIYTELVVEYMNFVTENVKIKKKDYANYIMNRGLDTITNIFKIMLLHTKNLDVTYFHCQKAFYYYVEFISQISEVEKLFLQLSSRDATTYVYKKTLFELNNMFVKPSDTCTNEIFDLLSYRISISQQLVSTMIHGCGTREDYIKQFLGISSSLNKFPMDKAKLDKLERVICILHAKIENKSIFYTTVELLSKKIQTCSSDMNPDIDFSSETPIIEQIFGITVTK